MRLDCPFCGSRDQAEFVYRGDAAPVRPADGEAGMFDYVYVRANVAGPMREHWYHAMGCRSWIEVMRDTRTHEMLGVTMAGYA